jgi:hypothetical protein
LNIWFGACVARPVVVSSVPAMRPWALALVALALLSIGHFAVRVFRPRAD